MEMRLGILYVLKFLSTKKVNDLVSDFIWQEAYGNKIYHQILHRIQSYINLHLNYILYKLSEIIFSFIFFNKAKKRQLLFHTSDTELEVSSYSSLFFLTFISVQLYIPPPRHVRCETVKFNWNKSIYRKKEIIYVGIKEINTGA